MQRLFSEVKEVIQAYQPVHLTGAALHIIPWITASFYKSTLLNAQFINHELKKEEVSTFPRGIAIYCIHGTADLPSSFSKLASRMLKHLPEEISAIYFVSFEGRGTGLSIPAFAMQLIKKIESNKDSDIFLIGHSRGGIIAKETAITLAQNTDIKVHGIVTIASPLKGSYLATKPLTFFSKSVKQMEMGSEYLTALEEKSKLLSLHQCSISAEKDSVVSPDACHTEGSLVRQFDRHGHLSIMSSIRVAHFIAIEITKRVNELKVNVPEAPPLPVVSLTSLLSIKDDYIKRHR